MGEEIKSAMNKLFKESDILGLLNIFNLSKREEVKTKHDKKNFTERLDILPEDIKNEETGDEASEEPTIKLERVSDDDVDAEEKTVRSDELNVQTETKMEFEQ